MQSMKAALATRGIGLLDVVIGTTLLLVVFVGLFGVLQLGTRMAGDSKARTTALALTLEHMEFIRSLPYTSIGTVGGTPPGSLLASEALTLNNISYTRTTAIRYVDDEKDGIGVSDTNGSDDYKRVKVVVSWEGPTGTRETQLVTDIAPRE